MTVFMRGRWQPRSPSRPARSSDLRRQSIGGWFDTITSRLVDLLMSDPHPESSGWSVLSGSCPSTHPGPDPGHGASWIPPASSPVGAAAADHQTSDFVERGDPSCAAEAAPDWWIIFREILPKRFSPLVPRSASLHLTRCSPSQRSPSSSSASSRRSPRLGRHGCARQPRHRVRHRRGAYRRRLRYAARGHLRNLVRRSRIPEPHLQPEGEAAVA